MLARFVAILALALAALSAPLHAETSTRRDATEQITGLLLDKILIDRERRSGAGSDFAAKALTVDDDQLAGFFATADGAAVRQRAARAAARIAAAPSRTAYLRWFPDPQRVRDDIAKASQDQSALVVAARQQGRFQMLAQVLEHLQLNVYRDTWPDDVLRQWKLYLLYLRDVRDRIEPQLEPTGKGCSILTRAAGRCKRLTASEERGTYAYDLAQAQEVARLYFPASFRPRFIDASGTGVSRAGDARNAERETQRAEEYNRQQEDRKQADRRAQWRSITTTIFLPLAVLAAFIGAAVYLVRRSKEQEKQRQTTTNHGSAHWGGPELHLDPLTPLRGVFLGKYAWPDHNTSEAPTLAVFTRPESHTLVMAPTRTGKGTRIIVPTLLRYAGSMLVIDPKGENAAIAGRQRKVIGPTYILNPWAVLDGELAKRGFRPARYNPLDAIRAGDPDAASIAHTMAESICARSGDAKNVYWEGSATAILTGVFLWLADQPGESKTLARARQIVTLPLSRLEKEFFIPMAASSAFGGAIAENVGPFLAGESKDMPSILRTLAEATRFISDERLKAATAASDFDLRTFPFRPSTLFLVIPPDRMKTQATWLRLMLAAFTHAYRTATPRFEVRGMMMVDELPALGYIPELPTDLATMSGYGLDYLLAVQDMGQLEAIYGKQARSIMANCAWKWLCNVRDKDTAKYVSETLGNATIATETTNEGTSASGATSGKTYGEMGRPLLTPDEVMNLGRERAIVLPPVGRPVLVWGIDYWHICREFERHRDRDMRAYYAQPLVIDPNPYRQQESQ